MESGREGERTRQAEGSTCGKPEGEKGVEKQGNPAWLASKNPGAMAERGWEIRRLKVKCAKPGTLTLIYVHQHL